MHAHRPLVTAALLLAGVALAQTSGGTSSSPPSNPRPSDTGSMTTPPGMSGTETRSGSAPGGAPLAPPVSGALGTTPSPEMVLADLRVANEFEVDVGKIAEQKASNKDVKKFAKHMVKAHTEMDKDGQRWAQKRKLPIGSPPQDATHQAEMQKIQQIEQRLQTLSGAEFDKAYMQAMAEAHASDLNKVRTFEYQAIDDDFQKLLTKFRKEIAEHKWEADKLVQRLGSPASG